MTCVTNRIHENEKELASIQSQNWQDHLVGQQCDVAINELEILGNKMKSIHGITEETIDSNDALTLHTYNNHLNQLYI